MNAGQESLPKAKGSVSKLRPAKAGDDAKQRILRAALYCFASHGFEGASTRVMAKMAGVTSPLLLYHFGKKENLWIETVRNALNDYLEFVHCNISDNPKVPARKSLEKFIAYFVRFSAEYPEIHKIMSMESAKSDRLEFLLQNYVQPYFNKICGLIRRGHLEGSVIEGDPAHIFYHIISTGTLFSISYEYEKLTGRSIFSEAEIHKVTAHVMRITLV